MGIAKVARLQAFLENSETFLNEHDAAEWSDPIKKGFPQLAQRCFHQAQAAKGSKAESFKHLFAYVLIQHGLQEQGEWLEVEGRSEMLYAFLELELEREANE